MTFSNIFKKSFLEGYSSTEITSVYVITALCIAAFLAAYIFFVYRVVTRKTFFSKTFAISMAGITVITAAIIITVQSSVVISLGMVGALSIVRFRTAIKDPMDLMFLFWAIGVGIICGAGLAQIAVILSVVITIGIVVLDAVPVAKAPMILVINAQNTDVEPEVEKVLKQSVKHYHIKSRNMTSTTLDMIVELRTSQGSKLIKDIMAISGIESASLLSHDGEVTF